MRVTNERLAEYFDCQRGFGPGEMDRALLDLRDERALADKLAEALRIAWQLAPTRKPNGVLQAEAGALLAAYDKSREKR